MDTKGANRMAIIVRPDPTAPQVGQPIVLGPRSIRGTPVFDLIPDHSDIKLTSENKAKVMSTMSNEVAAFNYQNIRKLNFKYAFLHQVEIDNFISFFCQRYGAKEEFYCPSWIAEIPNTTTTPGMQVVTVDTSEIGFFERAVDIPNALFVVNLDTSEVFYSGFNYTVDGDNFIITLDKKISFATNNARMGFCYLVRFDSDAMALNYRGGGVAEVSLALIEIPSALYSSRQGRIFDESGSSHELYGTYTNTVVVVAPLSESITVDNNMYGIYMDGIFNENGEDAQGASNSIESGVHVETIVFAEELEEAATNNELYGSYYIAAYIVAELTEIPDAVNNTIEYGDYLETIVSAEETEESGTNNEINNGDYLEAVVEGSDTETAAASNELYGEYVREIDGFDYVLDYVIND